MSQHERTKKERWIEIENSEGNYQISSNGRVLSFREKQPHHLKPQTNNYGDNIIFLKFPNDFLARTMLLSYLVAEAFVPNPNHYRYIRFKDGNKSNCCAENLEWVQKTNRMKKFVESRCRKVYQYDLNGSYIEYEMKIAGEQTDDKKFEFCVFAEEFTGISLLIIAESFLTETECYELLKRETARKVA